MSQLLKTDTFSIPKYGTINLHPSFLPEYRGPNPDFWQYYDKNMSPGMTVHYIDKGEDTGDILLQDKAAIPLGTKSPDRLDTLVGTLGKKLVFKALDAIEKGSVIKVKQPEISPTPRARNLEPSEHETIIDWDNWDIAHIWHVLRGTELWLNALQFPVEFSRLYSGHRWVVGEMQNCNMANFTPAQIYKEKGKYFVACRDGKIFLSVELKIIKMILGILKNDK